MHESPLLTQTPVGAQQPPLLQMLSLQHGWPAPPQSLQLPSEQIPPARQVSPLWLQTLLTQQPPAWQLSPLVQQAWPGPPHVEQVPAAVQAAPP